MTAVAAVIIVMGGCSKPSTSAEPKLTALSASIQQEFKQRTADIDNRAMNASRQRLDTLHRILDEKGKTAEGAELARLVGVKSGGEFDDLLAQTFVERLLRSGNLQSLKVLLIEHCPDYVAVIPLEAVLVQEKRPEVFAQLMEAYAAGTNGVSHETIVRCLGRAFPVIRQSEKSDQAFVAACKAWWIANQNQCVVNSRYPHFPNPPPQDLSLEQSGLFSLKAK